MEMEVEFKREMNRSYMVLKQENTGTGRHAVQMMTKNRIPGLLPFQEKRVDGDCRYYYDITSRQPLARLLEYRGLSGAELRRLIGDILLVLRQMERYLLDESQLCLEPDMIYMEPAGSQSSLCLIPGRKVPFAIEFCELSQYLLDHIDHNDGEAVILAFAIFKESRKENFGIEDIEACLGQAGKVEAAPLRKREEDSGFLEEKLEEKKGKERKREEAGRPGAGRTEAGRPENGRSGKERSKTKKAETKKPEAERQKVEKVKTERLGAGRLEGRAKAIWLLPLCAIGTPLLL